MCNLCQELIVANKDFLFRNIYAVSLEWQIEEDETREFMKHGREEKKMHEKPEVRRTYLRENAWNIHT
jgi:hypothetical protein